jgi:deazaflavin-dependent oxidoreductase (nitroreductase family)
VPNIRWLLALITRIHRFIYLASGGWVGRFLTFRKRALLLTHTGRKSGKTYVVPLLYIEDGPRFIVVGSNAGDPREPQWWQNLKSHPRAEVQVGRQHYFIRSHQASDEETRQLWPKLEQSYRSFPRYRERSGRDIPVVVLKPDAN